MKTLKRTKKAAGFLLALVLCLIFVSTQIIAWAGETTDLSAVNAEEENGIIPESVFSGEEELTDENVLPAEPEEAESADPAEAENVSEEEAEETATELPEQAEPEEPSLEEEEEPENEVPENTPEPEVSEPADAQPEEVGSDDAEEPEEPASQEMAEPADDGAEEPEEPVSQEMEEPAKEPEAVDPEEPEDSVPQEDGQDENLPEETAEAETQEAEDAEASLFSVPEKVELVSVESTTSSLKIKWKQAENATSYTVYRKEETEAAFTELASGVTEKSYEDTSAEPGKVYFYTISAVNEEGEGEKDETGLDGMWIKQAVLTGTQSASGGVKVSWEEVEGADGYRVYRYSKSNSKWVKIAEVAKTSYVDTATARSVTQGNVYRYTVKAFNSTYGNAAYDPEGVYGSWLPVVKPDVNCVSKAVEVSWKKVKRADGYEVFYRRKGASVWKTWADVTETSVSKKGLKNGVAYEFQVVAYAQDGSNRYYGTTSSKAVVSLTYYPAPFLRSVKPDEDGLKITWAKVSGAVSYDVLAYNSQKGKWGKIANTTSTSFVDTKKAKNGVEVTYSVRAVFSDNKTGPYNKTGIRGMYLKPVKSVDGNYAAEGIRISWKQNSKADGYVIFRKEQGGEWVQVKKRKATSWTDTTASLEKNYRYRVLPYKKGPSRTVYFGKASKDYDVVFLADKDKMAMVKKAQGYSSSTDWLILVNCSTNRFGIFRWNGSKWELDKYWMCTTGGAGTPTVKGTFYINSDRGYSFGDNHHTCYYYSSFYGPYLIHSTLFYPGTFNDLDPRLGMHLSQGCVRLYIENAKWVYYNVPTYTTVVTYAE